MTKVKNEMISPSYFAVFTLAIIAALYMFAFHKERSKNRDLLHKYELLRSACKTVKEPIRDERK